MGAPSCGVAFLDGVVRTCARQGARAHDGAEEKIVALGAEVAERIGPCQCELGAGPSLMSAATRERVQGPGRGDRGADRGPASVAPRRWSGRPCGRSRDDGGAQTAQRRRRHGRPRGVNRCLASSLRIDLVGTPLLLHTGAALLPSFIFAPTFRRSLLPQMTNTTMARKKHTYPKTV